ncbi:unnamed protein product, partial [Effrenium voratum]
PRTSRTAAVSHFMRRWPLGVGFCCLGLRRMAEMAATAAPPAAPGVVVLLRHGEREDYMAEKVGGQGAEWIRGSPRPWDPKLAPHGRRQALAAAQRLRQVLDFFGLPPASRIFTSPLVRCVETADFVAQQFEVPSLCVEDDLAESINECWMRQWAVPGANSDWGGPPSARVKSDRSLDPSKLRGPAVDLELLRPEALQGTRSLLHTAEELKSMGWQVDLEYRASNSLHDKGYLWGSFEVHQGIVQRMTDLVRHKVAQHPGETLVFVSHGGPTKYTLEHLSGQSSRGMGGMTAISVLRPPVPPEAPWEVLLSNDASHGEAFAFGEETKI